MEGLSFCLEVASSVRLSPPAADGHTRGPRFASWAPPQLRNRHGSSACADGSGAGSAPLVLQRGGAGADDVTLLSLLLLSLTDLLLAGLIRVSSLLTLVPALVPVRLKQS